MKKKKLPVTDIYNTIFKTGEPKLVKEVFNDSVYEGEDSDEIEYYAYMELKVPFKDCKDRAIIYTCSYKGEGEAWVFVEDAVNMPVYTPQVSLS